MLARWPTSWCAYALVRPALGSSADSPPAFRETPGRLSTNILISLFGNSSGQEPLRLLCNSGVYFPTVKEVGRGSKILHNVQHCNCLRFNKYYKDNLRGIRRLVTTFWSLEKVEMKQAFRKRFGVWSGIIGFERTVVFDYCAKGDKPWCSKYCGISEVGMGISRKILRQGVDHVSSCVHKNPPENDKLSRCNLRIEILKEPN